MHKIAFAKFGSVIVHIDIKPFDDIVMLPVRFKVDTGADTTTISKPELIRIGYTPDWIRDNVIISEGSTTASGDEINTGYIQLPLINIFGYEGKQWPFLIILDEDKDFRNLLGRDLLAGFNYQFNNDDDVFSINMAKIFKPRYKFLSGQEIYEMISDSPSMM